MGPADAQNSSEFACKHASKRLVIIGPSARSLRCLRGGLITESVSRRHQVETLTPAAAGSDALSLGGLGASVAPIAMQPEKFSLWPERAVMTALAAQLAAIRPHAVLAYGASLVPLAVKAARKAGVPRVAVILSELENGVVTPALRRALKSAHVIIAHNAEDVRAVTAAGLGSGNRTILKVAGAGADLADFSGLALPPLEPEVVFVMASRLDKSKGVLEFCEAARQLRAGGASAKFILAGDAGTGPGAVAAGALVQFDGAVTRVGHTDDLKSVIAAAHVFVAPSYREGMPHAVLQALAAGRPCIVTDIPGSRDTVDEMVNGMLVPPRDANALAGAFRRMLKRTELISIMGRASRLKAERHFSASAVNAALMTALELP